MALLGPQVMSDLSPQSGPNRTLIRFAILRVHALDCAGTMPVLSPGGSNEKA
jgi:hypothetical protein